MLSIPQGAIGWSMNVAFPGHKLLFCFFVHSRLINKLDRLDLYEPELLQMDL